MSPLGKSVGPRAAVLLRGRSDRGPVWGLPHMRERRAMLVGSANDRAVGAMVKYMYKCVSE